MNAPEKLVTELIKEDVCIPVGLSSNTNDDVIDTVVTYFSLTPSSEPENEWVTVLVPTGEEAISTPEIALSSLEYQFNSFTGTDVNQKVLENYQKAILIIDLPEKTDAGEWTFEHLGAVFDPQPENCKVEQTITNESKRLILSIENVVSTESPFDLKFVYKASYTNAEGVLTAYTSPDPIISVGRVEL